MAGHWLGLMSGTSCDGIDAALVWIDGRGDAAHPVVRLEAFATVPYVPEQRQQLLRVGAGNASLSELCQLNAWLAHRLADAAEHVLALANFPSASLLAVGSHGHTVCHLPDAPIPCTLQLGEPAILAARLGCRVVADFRPADMAVGGQGAPLIPFVDVMLHGKTLQDHPLVCLNLGGIANITFIAPDATRVVAFDTGPGNMTLDAACAHYYGSGCAFDAGGKHAAAGTVCDAILARLLQDAFFGMPAPKSTGRERFGEAFMADFYALAEAALLTAEDALATLTELTAVTVANAIRPLCEGHVDVLVGGGGVHNAHLMARLQHHLPHANVRTYTETGIDADAREAVAFALLAYAHLMDLPNNLPAATGARCRARLGKLCLPPGPMPPLPAAA